MRRIAIALLMLAGLTVSCASHEAQSPTPTPECAATDQDNYVHAPWRLKVLAPCVRVSGIVRNRGIPTQPSEDGDAYIDLEVDSLYEHYLNQANKICCNGFLHIEIVCFVQPEISSTLALLTCSFDHDAYQGPFPNIGDHVWVEGRYVLDVNHEGWAELRPMYRWESFK